MWSSNRSFTPSKNSSRWGLLAVRHARPREAVKRPEGWGGANAPQLEVELVGVALESEAIEVGRRHVLGAHRGIGLRAGDVALGLGRRPEQRLHLGVLV